jgi:hypothetical protein
MTTNNNDWKDDSESIYQPIIRPRSLRLAPRSIVGHARLRSWFLVVVLTRDSEGAPGRVTSPE